MNKIKINVFIEFLARTQLSDKKLKIGEPVYLNGNDLYKIIRFYMDQKSNRYLQNIQQIKSINYNTNLFGGIKKE